MHIDMHRLFPIYARLDTIIFLLNFHLPKEMVTAFTEANGGRFRPFGNLMNAYRWGWQQGIILQSPTRAALEIAATISTKDLIPVRLDPCLDHIQPDQQTADIYTDFMQKHAIQSNVRTETLMCVDTSYSARHRGRTNLVMYSTKLDKVTGQHCAHIEIRIKGGAKLKRMGLGTIQQILDFDHSAFWEKHLILIDPRYRTEQQVIDAVVARNRYKNRDGLWNCGNAEKRIANLIHRARATTEDRDDTKPIVFPAESRRWERALLINGTRPKLLDKTPYMPTVALDNPKTIIQQATCHTSSYWQDFEHVEVLRSCQ